MRFWQRWGLFLVCVSCFQNCGKFKADQFAAIYPYTEKPNFFYDLKAVSIETDDLGRESHVFDLALTFAEDFNQTVNFQLAFSTIERSGICTTIEASALGAAKHRRFTCIMPTPDVLFLQLTVIGPGGEQEEKIYRF